VTTVIGVRFRHAGRIYYFNPGPFTIHKGDYCIVETSRGMEYGLVVTEPRLAGDEDLVAPLRSVIRKATDEDRKTYEANLASEKDAFKLCEEQIQKHGLDMHLTEAEYTFDGKKLIFYFTADGRVDFRELVKSLAGVFHTRTRAAPDRRARRSPDGRRNRNLAGGRSAASRS